MILGMNKRLSVKNQKMCGTYERNLEIIKQVGLGFPQALIARKYKLSRQAVNQIIQRSKKAGK